MAKAISYDKLWKLLIDKKMNRTDLKDKNGISTASPAKLGKNENLREASARVLTSFMASLRSVALFVLDEIRFIAFNKEAGELLFQIVSDCYEQKSLIITSNLEFSQRNTVFGNDRKVFINNTVDK